jgi:serine/threonine-protein kinase
MFQISPGTIIDERYRVVSRVGSGGMAEVYCAEDLQLGRRVAVKLLHERFAQDPEFVERFRREASSAASLSHANIVSVYDRGEWGGTYYIAMELLEGRSLDTIVREEAPLTPERAIELTEQVLRAARFAHRHGVVHRDLKPHNVIIDSEGRVKVTDFGIARAGASEITQTGSIMGTARYLSPEQAQGEAVGPRSDLYAIGILLYELLTGTVPFEGDSVVAIALRHLSEPPRPPSTLVSSISPQLDAIVLRALAKDPDQRFADADEFLDALNRERERLRAEDGSRTASFAPLVLPAIGAPAARPGAPGTQMLLPAPVSYGEPSHWDPNVTSVISGGPPPSRRSSPMWPWALFGALLAAAAIVALLYLLLAAHKTVPSVTGDNEYQAIAALEHDGFQVPPATLQSSSLYPNGTVIAQNPAAGTQIAKGDTVAITVSTGAAAKAVPDVTNQQLPAAEYALRHKGFRYSTSQQPSTTVKSGYVISTNPGVGSVADSGSIVALTVSSGAPRVALVNVVALQFANAQSVLLADGFQVKEVKVSSELPPGQVISEKPGTAKAPEGSTVTLTVAKIPTTATVPPLTGDTLAVATTDLQSAGLTAASTTQPVTDPSENGLVVSQSPVAGAVVKKGTTVTVAIGSYTGSTGTSGPTTATTGASGTT